MAAIVDGGDGQPAVRVPAGDTDDETGRLVAVSAGLSAAAAWLSSITGEPVRPPAAGTLGDLRPVDPLPQRGDHGLDDVGAAPA